MKLPEHVTVEHNTLSCRICEYEGQIPEKIRSDPEARLEYIEMWTILYHAHGHKLPKYVM